MLNPRTFGLSIFEINYHFNRLFYELFVRIWKSLGRDTSALPAVQRHRYGLWCMADDG
jgi:hypothetical protein